MNRRLSVRHLFVLVPVARGGGRRRPRHHRQLVPVARARQAPSSSMPARCCGRIRSRSPPRARRGGPNRGSPISSTGRLERWTGDLSWVWPVVALTMTLTLIAGRHRHLSGVGESARGGNGAVLHRLAGPSHAGSQTGRVQPPPAGRPGGGSRSSAGCGGRFRSSSGCGPVSTGRSSSVWVSSCWRRCDPDGGSCGDCSA